MHVFVLVSVVIFGAAMILLVVVVANLGSGVLQVILKDQSHERMSEIFQPSFLCMLICRQLLQCLD